MNQPPTLHELTVREIGVTTLDPNPWNPNRLSPAMSHKLKVYIQREGLVEPLVVRPKADGRLRFSAVTTVGSSPRNWDTHRCPAPLSSWTTAAPKSSPSI